MEKNRTETTTRSSSGTRYNDNNYKRTTQSVSAVKPHLTMMSWKAIFAGFFISLFVALILTS